MSKWRDRYKSAASSPERGGQAAGDLERYPILSEAMGGVPGTATGTWEVPPQSLTIWFEGPWVKFCLGSDRSDVKTFGSFQGFDMGLDGVEKALDDGKCETKKVAKHNAR